MSPHLSTHLCTHMPVYISTPISAHMSTHLSTRLIACTFTHLSTHTPIHICLHTRVHRWQFTLFGYPEVYGMMHASLPWIRMHARTLACLHTRMQTQTQGSSARFTELEKVVSDIAARQDRMARTHARTSTCWHVRMCTPTRASTQRPPAQTCTHAHTGGADRIRAN